MDEIKDDPVNSPRHYSSHPSGVEAIDVGRWLTACWFNAFKYVYRCDHKNGRQDVEKAIWYLKDAVKHNISAFSVDWRYRHQQLLIKIIDVETNEHKAAFYRAVLLGQTSTALESVEDLLEHRDDDE